MSRPSLVTEMKAARSFMLEMSTSCRWLTKQALQLLTSVARAFLTGAELTRIQARSVGVLMPATTSPMLW
jgi:hypothetical protein